LVSFSNRRHRELTNLEDVFRPKDLAIEANNVHLDAAQSVVFAANVNDADECS
jgi:hypothetical protein